MTQIVQQPSNMCDFQQSVSWFSEYNATELQESINVIQPLQVLLWKFDTPTGLLDILRPRNRPLPTLISTPLSLCLLVCTQCCHVICKAECVPASANSIEHIIPKSAFSQAGFSTGQTNAWQYTLLPRDSLLYKAHPAFASRWLEDDLHQRLMCWIKHLTGMTDCNLSMIQHRPKLTVQLL